MPRNYVSNCLKTTKKKNNKDGVKNVSYLPICLDKTDSIGVHHMVYMVSNTISTHSCQLWTSYLQYVRHLIHSELCPSKWNFIVKKTPVGEPKEITKTSPKTRSQWSCSPDISVLWMTCATDPGICLNPRCQWNFEGKPSLLATDF